DVSLADDKRRPDGTDILAARRPELYAPLTAAPRGRRAAAGADSLSTALAVADPGLLARIAADGVELIVLPELAAISIPEVVDALDGTTAHVVLSARVGGSHHGVLITADGVLGRQAQLHPTKRLPWLTEPGTDLTVFDVPWGRLAIVVGDDALFPETFRLAALQDADIVAVPCSPTEPWELALGLSERAAENRLNVVAAGSDERGGLLGAVYALSPDFTLWTAWSGPFAGVISHPIVTVAPPDAAEVRATVRPAQAVNRAVSKGTDLVDGRPRWPLDAMTRHAQ
ncbi:carbon-nitrogen hydrolase family protein, partial [Nocardia salmonicida]